MTDEEILPTSFDELSDDQKNTLYIRWSREHVQSEHIMDFFSYDEKFKKHLHNMLRLCSAVYPYNDSFFTDIGMTMYYNFIDTIEPHVREKFETETDFAMAAMPDTVDQEVDEYFQKQIDKPKCEI